MEQLTKARIKATIHFVLGLFVTILAFAVMGHNAMYSAVFFIFAVIFLYDSYDVVKQWGNEQ